MPNQENYEKMFIFEKLYENEKITYINIYF